MSSAFAHSAPQAPLARAARHGLTAQKRQVIHLLAQGVSVTRAAEEAGVHRTTINHWQRSNPLFLLELEQARQEISAKLRDQYLALAPLAMEALRDLLASPKTPAATRLKAITLVLNAAMAEVDPAHLLPEVESAIHQNSSAFANEEELVSSVQEPCGTEPVPLRKNEIHQNSSHSEDIGQAPGHPPSLPDRSPGLDHLFAEMEASLTAPGILDHEARNEIHQD